MRFTGIFPALITPFSHGQFDATAFRQHIDFVIVGGVDGIVPCGTTGEAGALSPDEYRQVVQIAVAQAKGRVPVIGGAGANITAKAIALTQLCADCGVDGLLHVTPYYNKPTQEGLFQHFAAIAQATTLPIILYNVPGRTGVNLSPETVGRLTQFANIIGLKDASASLDQARATQALVGADFTLLSGEDGLNADLYALGYRGSISVTANIAPDRVCAVWQAAHRGDMVTAQSLQATLQALNQAMFFESNPLPVKTALALMGRCQEEWRLPMCPMTPALRERLRGVLRQYELIT